MPEAPKNSSYNLEEKNAKALEFIEDVTANADDVQKRVLAEILSSNADVEYLKRHGLSGRTDRDTFKALIPVITYEDIQPDITRIANGEKDQILCSKPISEFLTSSGTSGGERKLMPTIEEEMGRRSLLYSLLMPVMSQFVPGLEKGKGMYFLFIKSEAKTPGGLAARPVLTAYYKSTHFRDRAYDPYTNYTSPNEAILCPDSYQSMYSQLLCGLCQNKEVLRVGAVFASGFIRAIRFLEKHWPALCNDIRTGTLNPQIIDPAVREAVGKILKTDPKLADFIKSECSKESWQGIITRLWPNTKYVDVIVTGTMSQYIPTLDYYSNGLPLVCTMYASSECYFGVNLNPLYNPSDVSYTLIPTMAYFEFLPVNRNTNSNINGVTPNSNEHFDLVNLADVKLGQEYELVVTTYAEMGGDTKAETTKKQQQPQPAQQPQQQQQQNPQQQQQQSISSSSPKHPLEEATEQTRPLIISAPLFIPAGATSSSPFDPQQFDQAVTNPKRPRYSSTTGQWKLLPSPSSQQKVVQTQMTVLATESSPSPTAYPAATSLPVQITQTGGQLLHSAAASSSDTASSPSHSLPSLSASGQDTSKPEGENPVHQQFRKGKYVSPVWKPNEMLWLARAWRVQYQGGGGGFNGSGTSLRVPEPTDHGGTGLTKGKTRADKDKEVAEFLQRHGVNRDAKTAGTKWDNMLGEFRKVYEWERGGEREQVGKSYFRLSPYERKLHRLPASFDEEVFEELSQFMGSRMRTPQGRGPTSSIVVAGDDTRTTTRSSLPTPPPSFKEDDQYPLSARTNKQMVMGSGGEAFYYGGTTGSGRGGVTLMGFESSADIVGPSPPSSSSSKELRRIGKIRMTWEESVSLWAEEGEHHRGRVKLQGGSLSFLNADELTYFDDAMVACTMESFEEGPLRGFSVDRFVSGQQVKVFGRKKPFSVSAASGFQERVQPQLPFTEPSIRSAIIPPWEFQDPSDYYVGCLRVPPPSIPSLFELSWYLQEPPPDELRFPLRKDVYRDLPQGKDLFFTISTELLDCRGITYDILSPLIRPTPGLTSATATGRESFIGQWDDCINRIISKFCSLELVTIRKPTSSSSTEVLQDQWPNVTGFVRNFCLWRGEETDQLREGHIDPSNSIVEKLLWTYGDVPFILGYYAVGFLVTFCALSRAQDRIIRTDLQTLDLSSPSDRVKALVPCYRIAGLLPLLADRCLNNVNSKMLIYSDFERVHTGNNNSNNNNNGNVTEMTPNTVTRFFPNKRKWAAVKEIYDLLDHRIPHAEFVHRSSEKDLSLVFKPRGIRTKPANCDQLVEALKYVTKALVALHDLSFMHRDLSWDKVLMRRPSERGDQMGSSGGGAAAEWFVCGFEEAVGAPQIYPHGGSSAAGRGGHAPEMERGLHGVKVDVWGLGNLVRTCGVVGGVPKMLRELQNRCLDQNPELRPTAADCYHHLLQLQSSLHSASAAAAAAGGVLM